MSLHLERSGQAAAFASPARQTENAQDDRQLREMTAAPKFRRALVTDGRSTVGQAIASALAAAGATVYVGIPDAWKPFPGDEKVRKDHKIVPLNVADERSVRNLAADIGGKIDILVNTSDHIRPGGLLDQHGVSTIRDAIENTYIGFVHLAQAFGPVMRLRGADGVNSAAAWVNILSVYAHANWPAFGAYTAVEAPRLSLSPCQRNQPDTRQSSSHQNNSPSPIDPQQVTFSCPPPQILDPTPPLHRPPQPPPDLPEYLPTLLLLRVTSN